MTFSVYVMSVSGVTVDPLGGSELFSRVHKGVTGCWVSQGSQAVGGLSPSAVTWLRSVAPSAPSLTVAV